MNLKLYSKSLRYLGPRPRTEKEIRNFLTKHKATSSEIEEIVDELYQNKYLNDEDFAAAWIRTRALLKPKGWRVIKMELQQKGISEEILNKIHDSRFKNKDNEKEAIKGLIERKLPRYQGLPRLELFQKLAGFLIRRGFDYDLVKKCIDEALKKRV